MKNQLIALLDKVQAMRQAQNAYFKFKGDPEQKKRILTRSKQLESEVDIETARMKDQLVLNGLTGKDDLQLSERTRVIGELVMLSPRVEASHRAYLNDVIEDLKANVKGVPA